MNQLPGLVLACATMMVATACSEQSSSGTGPISEVQPGRITAMAATIWACPLENWRLGRDDGCDELETGTIIRIHKRTVQPDYPYGPFALIEYTVDGKSKMQYVIDNTVTPTDENDPSVEQLIERERQR